jgi:hypothetical protein
MASGGEGKIAGKRLKNMEENSFRRSVNRDLGGIWRRDLLGLFWDFSGLFCTNFLATDGYGWTRIKNGQENEQDC